MAARKSDHVGVRSGHDEASYSQTLKPSNLTSSVTASEADVQDWDVGPTGTRRGEGSHTGEKAKHEDRGSHRLSPLTINTELLDSFVLSEAYTEVRPIGFGAHGLVVSAVEKRGEHRRVAAKRVHVKSQLTWKYALREVRLLCQLKHDNLIQLVDVQMDEMSRQLYLLTELLDTSLQVLISQHLLSLEHVPLLTYQLLRGLHYLHSANVVHRDIKPSNIFVNCDTLLLKIGDFGLARVIDPNYDHSGHLTSDLGTYWYRAPELMLGTENYTSAVDAWGAGCVISELLLGRPLFTGATHFEQLRTIIDTVSLTEQDWSNVLHLMSNRTFPQHCCHPQRPLVLRLDMADPVVIDLLESLLIFNPKERATPSEALSHPYLAGYAQPYWEPVAVNPFLIESEVDDLPADILKELIQQEVSKERGERGMHTPGPASALKPMVSSATLSLQPATQPSGRIDFVKASLSMEDQHRHHQSHHDKNSASVDLSFLTSDKPTSSLSSPLHGPSESSSRRMYRKSGYTPRHSEPCPWMWPQPDDDLQEPKQSESTQSEQRELTEVVEDAQIEADKTSPLLSPRTGETHPKEMSAPLVEVRRRHYLKNRDQADLSITQQKPEGVVITHHKPRESSKDMGDGLEETMWRWGECSRRIGEARKPRKRGFADVGGFDEEDYIHLGLTYVDCERRASDILPLGKIESFVEKDQSCIDRELNRRNKSASLDLSYISPEPPLSGVSTAKEVVQLSPIEGRDEKQTGKSPASQRLTKSSLKVHEPAVLMSSTDVSPKKSSSVGIKILKSPKPGRKLGSSLMECQLQAVGPQERCLSTAVIGDCSSPVVSPERKLSITSTLKSSPEKKALTNLCEVEAYDSDRIKTNTGVRRSSNSSLCNDTPPSGSLDYDTPPSGTPTSGTGSSNTNMFSTPQSSMPGTPSTLSNQDTGHTLLGESKEVVEGSGLAYQTAPVDDQYYYQDNGKCTNCDNQHLLSHNEDLAEVEEIPERPASIISTLTIPPLSPALSPTPRDSPTSYSSPSQQSKKNISQTIVFLQNAAAKLSPREEVDKSGSQLYLNKESQKIGEEEKDRMEVSARKQQEDLEIAIHSASRREGDHQAENPDLATHSSCRGEYDLLTEEPVSLRSSMVEKWKKKVCRTELDIIPYYVTALNRPLPTNTFTCINTRCSQERSTKTTLPDESTLSQGESGKFTTKLFVDEGSSGCPKEQVDVARHVVISPKVTIPSYLPTPAQLDQVVSEDDLHSLQAAATTYSSPAASTSSSSSSYPSASSQEMHRPSYQLQDLPGSKQAVKASLTNLSISIPKDLPEKRCPVKAHSMESVSCKGEVITRLPERSEAELSQCGGSKLAWSVAAPSVCTTQPCESQGSACNHCLDQSDFKGMPHQLVPQSRPKFDVDLQSVSESRLSPIELFHHELPEQTIPEVWHVPIPSGLEGPDMGYPGRRLSSHSVNSLPDELCQAKDAFNIRQKLLGNGTSSDEDQCSAAVAVVKKGRPKSGEN